MKKRFTAVLALVMALMLGLTACGNTNAGTSTGTNAGTNAGTTAGTTNSGDATGTENPLAGTYDITVWVSEIDGVKEQFAAQIDAFEAANPGVVINATIEGISEADSATQMITSVEDGADIYCFAQDQLARLVMAKALNPLGVSTSAQVTEMNDAGAVAAATVGGQLYCFPLTSDNGYYMYYDKSIVNEANLDSLEAIIADCEAAGKFFSMEVENAWYTASFFFATGCKSEWTTNDAGKFTAVDDTFNSPAGIVAVKGMQKILLSPMYNNSAAADAFAKGSGVVVSGPWCAADVQAILGDNYGATDLPSFTVDGQTYHMGSFSGNKLLGVKPQTDAVKAAVLQQLALYLTGEECQTQRFEKFNWGPSNLNAQNTDAVKTNPALSALAAQSAYAIPQGQIHGSWWDIGKQIATDARVAAETSDATAQAILDTYTASINALFAMSEDELNAWGVIGGINGTSWDTDFAMTEESAGVYVSDVLPLKAGEEFKVRQGKSWDVNFGQTFNGANVIVEADGNYKVKLTIISLDAGKEEAAIELIPQ